VGAANFAREFRFDGGEEPAAALVQSLDELVSTCATGQKRQVAQSVGQNVFMAKLGRSRFVRICRCDSGEIVLENRVHVVASQGGWIQLFAVGEVGKTTVPGSSYRQLVE